MVLWLGEGDAYALLGELLRAEYGLGVLPAMARGADGKPYFPGEPELHFNVSHSGGLAPWGWTWRGCAPAAPGWRGVCARRRNPPGWSGRAGTGGRFTPSGR